MSDDELRDKLNKLERDLRTIKNRSVTGDGTAFMVFFMWLCFFLNGCNFK